MITCTSDLIIAGPKRARHFRVVEKTSRRRRLNDRKIVTTATDGSAGGRRRNAGRRGARVGRLNVCTDTPSEACVCVSECAHMCGSPCML